MGILFFVMGGFLRGQWIEALPLAIIGGCLGWALIDFKRETRDAENKKMH